MAGQDAKDFNIFISSDGTSTGTKQKLEATRAVTVSTGRGTARVTGKDTTHAYDTDEGFSVSSAFMEQKPLGTVQAALWAAHDARTPVYAWIESIVADGMSFEGEFRVAVGEIASPEEGVNEHSFTLSADGAVTRTTTT